MTITEFLLARIAEAEAVARDGRDAVPPWGGAYAVVSTSPRNPGGVEYLAIDPARVLAECEAKRRIVERYADCVSRQSEPDYSTTEALIQSSEYEDWTLLALASVYADHADFREEWRQAC